MAIVVKTPHGGTWILPHVDELLHRGHHVTVVLPPGEGRLRSALQDRSVTVADSKFDFSFRSPSRLIRGLLALRGVILDLQPDVIMYHLFASALAVRLSTIKTGVPRVHMVAGPLYLDSAVIRTVERGLGRLDATIVAGSAHTAERYAAIGLKSRTVTIPYGVDLARYRPSDDQAAARGRLNIPTDDFLAIMVSYVYAPKRLVHAGKGIKGHDVLIDAWMEVHRRFPAARLLLVGAGFDAAGEQHREEIVGGRQLGGMGITWLDTVDDVRPYYAASDVSVSPSRSENHGAALEAGASGLPSIVSDAGALPETVTLSSGWIVPTGDVRALERALMDAIGRKADGSLGAMGDRAREHVSKNFDNQITAQAVVDVLERHGRRWQSHSGRGDARR